MKKMWKFSQHGTSPYQQNVHLHFCFILWYQHFGCWNKNPTETFLCSCQDCFFYTKPNWKSPDIKPGYHFYFMSFSICMLHFQRVFSIPLLLLQQNAFNGNIIIAERKKLFCAKLNWISCNKVRDSFVNKRENIKNFNENFASPTVNILVARCESTRMEKRRPLSM